MTFSGKSNKILSYLDSKQSLENVRRQSVNSDEILTIHVTNNCLKSWYDFKERIHFAHFTNIDIANALIGEKYGILIRQDCEKIENHLRRLTFGVKSKFVGKKRTAYIIISNQVKRIAIRRGELRKICFSRERVKFPNETEQILRIQGWIQDFTFSPT